MGAPGPVKEPRASATGPQQRPWHAVSLTGVSPAALVALAATTDHLFAATATEVLCFDTDGHLLWRQGGFSQVAALAAVADVTGIDQPATTVERMAVADRGARRVASLNGNDGKPLAQITSQQVPGGWDPITVTLHGHWIYVGDAANSRVVRLRSTL